MKAKVASCCSGSKFYYRVGELVNPNPQWVNEDNPLAVGLILEVRHMRTLAAEVRVLWSDIEGDPVWTPISEVLALKWQACKPSPPVQFE